ncbi:protein fem-1 homolog CG6966 isoform X2 [Nomia melanderi]|uniref:protein fem-1 homolog CG6966 isoform X2 n=1 Tax=Nomia melanderi TaxID=2448451 RepID=UPI00130453B6|nr:protein fem-1 homolog CG6966 isoform X2 [Nomia melanderi]XP_031836408.1 protein fem-1 homolog CG6966 isoform X2 [Nomia melanderi]XP_031836409.1 protein fem-1 homolog CG6966 isoform X2 [Nomia melanderi]XP_031836410.1 protein fem-1 homolog CG6966 isoform X2 [Nomia melanderi]XP_031836411.1 protein fem-1 homolog CG6966 isoform X2 [Nomia melanderi]XP_031836413.1 protein fem-1 homolog CG6966 isoform X2 [Nomia melanderi]XP_031836414.1 protein fem-1 homolog CG6966 isoform X2 [Nomia melanderi]XP_0
MDYEATIEDRFSRVILSLWEKDDVEKLVEGKAHGATPLVMACRNGHYDVAEYLIEKCGANIEQSGSVVFDGETIEGVRPLWCAVVAGHFALVKLLVQKGADVNSTTHTKSTPLRAACFDGYFDIVKLLVNYGADIEMANRHGHTNLMIASYRGHAHIVKYLLSLEADVNRKSLKGNTALHDCAEGGSLDIIKMLIKHGARMDADHCGMTPLHAAAVTGHKHIVEYFINMPHLVSRKERIDALELLGATYVDKKRDMRGAYELWKRAMDERYHPGLPPIPKPPPQPPIAAYNYVREVSDPEELNELNDLDEMRMQALVIRERILGPAHPDTHYYIRYRGAVYADGGQYSRCIELWNYALDMQQSILEPLDPLTQSSLTSFIQLFSFMISRQTSTEHKVPPVQREDILRVFKKAVMEVELGKKLLYKVYLGDLKHFTKVFTIAIDLACLLTRELPEEGSDEYIAVHKAIYELVRINAKGKRILHMLYLINSEETAVAGKYSTSKFLSPNLATALIKVGADVNSTDFDGNTPLHLAALSQMWQRDVVIALLEAGAHIDAVNNDDESFETLLRNKHLYHSVNPVKYTTLACLAARVVKKTYSVDQIPKHLQSFVEMH